MSRIFKTSSLLKVDMNVAEDEMRGAGKRRGKYFPRDKSGAAFRKCGFLPPTMSVLAGDNVA